MSDRFEDKLRDQLHSEAEQIREFPRSLRGRIREGITPQRRSGLVPQLALAGALVVVAAVMLVARTPQVFVQDVKTAISNILPTPSPAPQPFLCEDRSGGSTGVSTQLTTVRAASHESDGYDRVVFEFSGGIPSYDLTRQASAAFIRDASGQPVQLDGSAGLKLVFRDVDPASGTASDVKPGLASVRQVTQLGAFERVLTYGIGLSSSQCVRVTTLSAPSRLVVDVATTPSASTTAAPTPVPTASQTASLPPFACQDFSGGTAGGAMQLTDVRSAHQSGGYDRIVFEFTAPSGTVPHIPSYTVTRQASSNFVKDPSGQEVILQGSDGLRIVFHGASAAGSYPGASDLKPNLAVVKELEKIGDFEAVLSWGAGLSQDACIRTVELSGPTRLVVDVQTP
ncbi:MAG TPA: hypothetical protein VIT43_04030 [Candidatus Dormibacteraeota bacterium]